MTTIPDQLESIFKRAYEVLVVYAKANENNELDFVEFHTWRHHPASDSCGNTTEFRFQGCLGMGGKFWVSCAHFNVSCYSEDSTPARLAVIQKCREELRPLFVEWRALCEKAA
jgi:hypothetical protein